MSHCHYSHSWYHNRCVLYLQLMVVILIYHSVFIIIVVNITITITITIAITITIISIIIILLAITIVFTIIIIIINKISLTIMFSSWNIHGGFLTWGYPQSSSKSWMTIVELTPLSWIDWKKKLKPESSPSVGKSLVPLVPFRFSNRCWHWLFSKCFSKSDLDGTFSSPSFTAPKFTKTPNLGLDGRQDRWSWATDSLEVS